MHPNAPRNFAIALGWINGVLVALPVDFALYSLLGDAYPQGPATVLTLGVFALSGAKVGDRFGTRATRPMAVALGILLSLYLTIGLSLWMTHT
jgi:hypothetical protein